MFLSKYIML